MPKVTYLDGNTTQFGYQFTDGQPVEVNDAAHLNKFRGNRFFAVDDDAAPAPGLPDPDKQPEQSDQTPDNYTAVHRGRGSYSVMLGDTEVIQGLTKADADAFNALSGEDKAAYVETKPTE